MSFTVSQMSLAPIPGTHSGTGTLQSTNWVVDPASVPGSGKLVFSGLDVEVNTMLFEIPDKVVPNWFGVAVPAGITDFTRPHIFFHPTPGQAGYDDADYPTKTGKWPQLFYYMERLGFQLDGARRSQIIIMPFLTEARKDAGILVTDWQDVVTQILTLVRADLAPGDSSPLSIAQLAVSSFSAGIKYSDSFRANGAGVSDVLAEVWDLDGKFSSYSSITDKLHSTSQVQVIKYDQVPSGDTTAYHVPLPRWADLVSPPVASGDVHSSIRDFMFLDAAAVSGVGSVIPDSGGGTITAGTHTATVTVTSTAPGTGTTTATVAGSEGSTSAGTDSSTLTHTSSLTHSATATDAGSAGTHTASATATTEVRSTTLRGTLSTTGTILSADTGIGSPILGPEIKIPASDTRQPMPPSPTAGWHGTPLAQSADQQRGARAATCGATTAAIVAVEFSTAHTAIAAITAIAHKRRWP